jgi:hypothetical protein
MAPSARLVDVTSQRQALVKIAELIRSGSIDRRIIVAAKTITRDCDARDDLCELEAIFKAVKEGDARIPWLRRGVRYVADSYSFDVYNGVGSLIDLCSSGACGGDCDDHTILVGALAASLGFRVGARAFGKGSDQSDDYQHVYPVAAIPKSGPWPRNYFGHGMDTTVPRSYVGWEPEGGHIMTAWVD